MKKIFLVLVISLFLWTGNNVFALTYSESPDSELGYSWPFYPPDIGPLDSGLNKVSGTMNTAVENDDSFYFTLSDGMKLTGISMDFSSTNYTDDGDDKKYANMPWNLLYKKDGQYSAVYYTGPINILGSSSFVFSNLPLDLKPGDYRMANDIGVNTDDSWTTSYTLNFQVDSTAAPIPEPTTMLLFGTGLVGLAGIARKKMEK